MQGRDAPAADVEGAPIRRVHDHRFPGVDVALTAFPEQADQLAAVQGELDDVLLTRLCVVPDDTGFADIVLRLENAGAGHAFPSGAAQDRRVWAEVVAWSGTAQVFSTGVVADGDPVAASAATDPDLWLFRDVMLDGEGEEVHMFWEAMTVQTHHLPGVVTLDPSDPAFFHYVERTFDPGLSVVPDRVTARVRVRAMDVDVLDDLIASGDLDAGFRDAIPTFDIGGSVLEWTGTPGTCVP
jgi:hypothetical protein